MEVQHIFCYFCHIPLDGCVFFLWRCLSLCHLFFLFLKYQRSWNGLMIATMWKFIFWKYVLLTFVKMWNCVCKLLSEVCWEVNLFQRGELECIDGSGEPESKFWTWRPWNWGGSLDWETQLSFCTLFHLQSAWVALGTGHQQRLFHVQKELKKKKKICQHSLIKYCW